MHSFMKNNFCYPSEYQHAVGNLPHRDEHQEGDAWVRRSYASARDILQEERSLLLPVLVFLLFLWLVLVSRAPSYYFVLPVVTGHLRVGLLSQRQNEPYCENLLPQQIQFDMQTHRRMKSFERRLVLKQRQNELWMVSIVSRWYFTTFGYNSCFQSLRVCCHGFNNALNTSGNES